MAPRKIQPATAATELKVINARVKKPKRKGPVRLFENGLLNVDRKGGKHMKAIKHNAETLLLRLPGEIRNQIWGYVLGGQTFEVHSYRRTLPRTSRVITKVTNQPKNFFALLQTCRQIYADAVLLPQELNVFSFDSTSGYNWLQGLSKIRQEVIREIRVVARSPSYIETLLDVLSVKSLLRLRRVVVHVLGYCCHRHAMVGASPQRRLTDAEKESLRDVWKAKKTQAKLVFNDS